MHPSLVQRNSRIDITDAIPGRILDLLDSAERAQKLGDYGSCAFNCRKILEGVEKHFRPGSEGPLAQRIKDIALVVNLNENMSRLADLLRQCGNIAAHFDDQGDVTEFQAGHSLLLIEYLLDYLFILPMHMDALEDFLEEGI